MVGQQRTRLLQYTGRAAGVTGNVPPSVALAGNVGPSVAAAAALEVFALFCCSVLSSLPQHTACTEDPNPASRKAMQFSGVSFPLNLLHTFRQGTEGVSA